MSQVELLVVEDVFDISGHGLVVAPAFDIWSSWENREEWVTVTRGDGTSFSAQANFQRTHFKIFNREDSSSPWKVVVSFPSESKASVPVGSRIWVDEALKAALLAA
jgi:hypothetical protein